MPYWHPYINTYSYFYFKKKKWKERNSRAFDGIKGEMTKTRDRWLHFFGSVILAHDMYKWEDFGNIVYTINTL